MTEAAPSAGAPDNAPVNEAFGVVADLCIALGSAPVNQYAECWEHVVDDQWWIAMNGHREPKQCSRGVPVDPFTIYVEFNGWPAGAINPFGGWIAAGSVANEDTFIAAVQAATDRARSSPRSEP